MNRYAIQLLRIVAVGLSLVGVALTILVAAAMKQAGLQEETQKLLTALTPISFGVAGICALVAALFSGYTLKRESVQASTELADAADWQAAEATPIAAPWWKNLLIFIARRRERRLGVDLDIWYDRMARTAVHEGLYTGMVSVLVVVGIVFSFRGIGDSSQKLQNALGKSAAQVTAQQLQVEIAGSLQPLQEAFGANLVGIVFAIALLVGTLWARAVQKDALAALRLVLFDELEPLLDAEVQETAAFQAAAGINSQIEATAAVRELMIEQQRRQEALLLELSAHLRTANDQRVRLDERTESLDLTLKGLAPVIAESLAPVLRDQLEPSLKMLAQSLANVAKQTQGTASETASAVANGIADTLRASYDEALQQMREILGELNTWSLANRDALEQTAKSLTAVAQEQQVSFRLAVDAFDRLREVLPDLQQVVERLDGIVGTTHDMLQQGEAGSMRASDAQRNASESLAANTQSMSATLDQLQSLPVQMRGVVDQLEGRIRTLLEDSDRQAQMRLAVMDQTVRDLAGKQEAIADQTQQSMREFSQQLGQSVQATLHQAEKGLGAAGAEMAKNLERLLANSGQSVESTAEGLQQVITDGVGDLQDAFGQWREAMTAMAATVNAQAKDQELRQASSSQQVQIASNALRDVSRLLAELPPKIQEGMSQSGKDFQQRVQGSLGILTTGVGTEMTRAVQLLSNGLAGMEATAEALTRSTDSLGRVQDGGRDRTTAEVMKVAEQMRGTLMHVDATMLALTKVTDGLRRAVESDNA